MKKLAKAKGFLVGVFVGASLMISTITFASPEAISVFLTNMKFVVNNEEFNLSESALIKNGKSYVPIRDTAEMLGYDVKYEGSTKTAYFEPKEGLINDLAEHSTATMDRSDAVLVDNLIEQYTTDRDRLDKDKIQEDVENGVLDINSQDSETGETLLMGAVKKKDMTAFMYLAKNGADVNMKDFSGKTAVHHGAIVDTTLVGNLEEFGADLNPKDNEGKTPLDYAEYRSSTFFFLKIRVD